MSFPRRLHIVQETQGYIPEQVVADHLHVGVSPVSVVTDPTPRAINQHLYPPVVT